MLTAKEATKLTNNSLARYPELLTKVENLIVKAAGESKTYVYICPVMVGVPVELQLKVREYLQSLGYVVKFSTNQHDGETTEVRWPYD